MSQIGKINFVNGKIKVSYVIAVEKDENTGVFYCNIPSFNIDFYTRDENEIKRKSVAFIHSFIDYYLKRESFNSFILAINKLGFRSEKHMLKMKDMLNRKSNSGVFKISSDQEIKNKVQQNSLEFSF